MSFYAVANGRNKGIFLNWNDCHTSVKGYSNAVFKKFKTRRQAEDYMKFSAQDANLAAQRNLQKKAREETSSFSSEVFRPDYYVYTDGACANNGKENAVAGIGIFFGAGDVRNVSQRIKGKQTNNTAELTALIKTYPIIENDIINGKKVTIVSDSEYALKCISTYGEKCYQKSWNVGIPNKELVKQGYKLYKDKPTIHFMHIRSHTNKKDVHSIGNENADKLATDAIHTKC